MQNHRIQENITNHKLPPGIMTKKQFKLEHAQRENVHC